MWLQSFTSIVLFIVSITYAANNGKNTDLGNLKWDPKCHMTASYPPTGDDRTIPWYTIDLDTDPQDRWREPIEDLKTEIQRTVDLFVGSPVIQKLLLDVDVHCNEVTDRFPHDWGEEVRAIADMLDRRCADLIMYNVAYELFGLCTSIVAQDTDGHMYHGRNLDFGLYPDVNWSAVQWELTQDLRPILFNANFTRNGTTLYKSVVFGGYVGLVTGVRQNAMTITVDTRYDNNYDKYLIRWFRDKTDDSQFLSFVTRNAMEHTDNYTSAVSYISKQSFVGPCYIIIGGVETNEGAVITVGPNHTLYDYWDIPNALPNNTVMSSDNWYVLETNYDHWEQPPWFDDRRYPAEDCMNEIGSKGIDLSTMYNVLDAIPNRNRLTTYTALMDCKEGHLESYKQYCDEDDCVPW